MASTDLNDQAATDTAIGAALARALDALYGDELRAGTAVLTDPEVRPGLPDGLEATLRRLATADDVDIRIILGPELGRPRNATLNSCDVAVGRLLSAAELDDGGPRILIYQQIARVRGRPLVYASGPKGMSGRLVGVSDYTDMRGDFLADPERFMSYNIAAGRAWLGLGPKPDLADYTDRGFTRETVSTLEVAEEAGTNLVALGATTATVAAALSWVILRRNKGMAGVLEPTELPRRVRSRASAAIRRTYDEVPADRVLALAAEDPGGRAARTVGALHGLAEAIGALQARHAAGGLSPVDMVALWLMDQRWDELLRRPEAEPTGHCFFNPLHGRADSTVQFRSRHGALSVPTCSDCETAVESGTRPASLLVAPAPGATAVPYFECDDGYAHTGLGSLAPIESDVPGTYGPAVDPQPRAKASSPRAKERSRQGRSRVGRILAGSALVLGAVLAGGGLGIGGSQYVLTHALPVSQADAGRYADDYDRARIGAILDHWQDDPVYVSPVNAALLDPAQRASLAGTARDVRLPIYVALPSLAASDESGGSVTLLANRLAAGLAERGQDGIVFVATGYSATIASAGRTPDDEAARFEVLHPRLSYTRAGAASEPGTPVDFAGALHEEVSKAGDIEWNEDDSQPYRSLPVKHDRESFGISPSASQSSLLRGTLSGGVFGGLAGGALGGVLIAIGKHRRKDTET
jgi:hypothetical protein